MKESAHYSRFQAIRDALAARQSVRKTSTIFRVILPESGLSLKSRPVEVDALVVVEDRGLDSRSVAGDRTASLHFFWARGSQQSVHEDHGQGSDQRNGREH
jgi:hypothetical protein